MSTLLSDAISQAQNLCKEAHDRQIRRISKEPYFNHPFRVASILQRYGYDDILTQVVAYLHDVHEDGFVRRNGSLVDTLDVVEEAFGKTARDAVFVLSRNTIRGIYTDEQEELIASNEQYKERLMQQADFIKRIKIADTIDNTRDLHFYKNIHTQNRRLNDIRSFYIPLGKDVAPIMVQGLIAMTSLFDVPASDFDRRG